MRLPKLSMNPWKDTLSIFEQSTVKKAMARYFELNPEAIFPVEMRYYNGRLTRRTYEQLARMSLELVQKKFEGMFSSNNPRRERWTPRDFGEAVRKLKDEAYYGVEAISAPLNLYTNSENIIKYHYCHPDFFWSGITAMREIFDRYNQNREQFAQFARKNNTDIYLFSKKKSSWGNGVMINGSSLVCRIWLRKLSAIVTTQFGKESYQVPLEDARIQLVFDVTHLAFISHFGREVWRRAQAANCRVAELPRKELRSAVQYLRRVDFQNVGPDHSVPHVGRNGYMCPGSFGSNISSAMAFLDFELLIHWLREWAQTYIIGNTGGPITSIDKYYMGIPKKFGALGLAAGKNTVWCANEYKPTLGQCKRIGCQIGKECGHYRSLISKKTLARLTKRKGMVRALDNRGSEAPGRRTFSTEDTASSSGYNTIIEEGG